MYIGDFIPVGSGDLFTNWSPRGGDNGVFTFETIFATGVALTIRVFHKDSDDQGPGTLLGTISTAVGSSRFTEQVLTGIKELVRYQITCADVSGGAGAIYRILQPNWFNTARGKL
jgi:hypothetical protein